MLLTFVVGSDYIFCFLEEHKWVECTEHYLSTEVVHSFILVNIKILCFFTLWGNHMTIHRITFWWLFKSCISTPHVLSHSCCNNGEKESVLNMLCSRCWMSNAINNMQLLRCEVDADIWLTMVTLTNMKINLMYSFLGIL